MVTYIYALVDPRTDEIRYIGKSNNPRIRLAGHICVARTKQHHRARWIRKLLEFGLRPYAIILEKVVEGIWQEREQWWIAKLRVEGIRLVNETDGGDGALGLSERARQIGKEANRKWIRTPEIREKISIANRGRPMPQEMKERISATLRGRAKPKEVGEKISAAKTGFHYTEESRMNMAKAHSHLSDDAIREIRQMVSNGICHRIIAEKFNTSGATVCRIAKRRVYGWVE